MNNYFFFSQLINKTLACFFQNLYNYNIMNIDGNVEDIIYRNVENGYTVFNLDNNGILVTCVGKCTNISVGEYVELLGNFTKNAKFGEQFAFTEIKASKPKSIEGIKKYLASGLIRGIGPVTAEAIVERFKEDTLNIIELAPERLAEIKGVSLKKATEIGETFSEIKRMQNAVMFLQEFGLSTNMSVKIFNVYQENTVEVVSQNPYKLIEDIDGIGFLSADKIAASMGVAKNSEFRVRAGVLHLLKDSSEKGGNTYLPEEVLKESVLKLLEIDKDDFDTLFNSALESLILDNVIKVFMSKGVSVVMLKKFYFMEQSVAQKINMLNFSKLEQTYDIESEIAEFERVNGITLHEDQKNAVRTAVRESVCIITGGPGTGKTTIIKCILQIIKNYTNRVYLLAPTGRASKRLSESCGADASTIHRALEVNFTDADGTIFNYNDRNKLPADVVIVDEVSMLDVNLCHNLLKALPNTCKLILVGDKDQLPSVGAGNVLHDLLKSGVVEVVQLTYIYRQSETSLIVSNAHLINQGKMPDLTNKGSDFFYEPRQENIDILHTVVDLVSERLPRFLHTEARNIQVLAPMRNGVCGVDRMNKELQAIINPESLRKNSLVFENTTYREGDKVMQIVNNYNLEWRKETDGVYEKGKGVFNGDMGTIVKIDYQTGETNVLFDDDKLCVYSRADIFELQICYATTIHKSQGSEFDAVVIPVMPGSNQIITRNLLYTAVTRAKKLVVLVGAKKNIARMIYNNYTAQRYSMLGEFLLQQKKKVEFMYS